MQCQKSWCHQAKRAVSPKGLTILLPSLASLPAPLGHLTKMSAIINLDLCQLNHFVWWNYTTLHINAPRETLHLLWPNGTKMGVLWVKMVGGGGETDFCFSEQWGCFKGMECGWWDGVMVFYELMIVIHNYASLPCFFLSSNIDTDPCIRSCRSNSD